MKSKIAIIGDIHFGVDPSERIYQELRAVLNYLNEDNGINVVQLNGDYFHKKLTFTDSAGFLAIKFFNELLDVCERKKIKLRLLQGTLTHDLTQCQILCELAEKRDIDFRYIPTVQTETLNGLEILYIPEEYPKDAVEYYHDFMYDKDGGYRQYDAIFLHGMLDNTGLGMINKKANDTSINSAPFFICADWKHCLEHGVCIAGHYHGRIISEDCKFIYPGSFSAWDFNFVSKKGWCVLTADSDSHIYSYELMDNELCPVYRSIKVTELKLDADSKADVIVNAIKADAEKVSFLKVDVGSLADTESQLVTKAFDGDKKVKIVSKEVSFFKESFSDDAEKAKFEKYKYLLDGDKPVDQCIQQYIKEENKKDLTLESIDSIITPRKA